MHLKYGVGGVSTGVILHGGIIYAFHTTFSNYIVYLCSASPSSGGYAFEYDATKACEVFGELQDFVCGDLSVLMTWACTYGLKGFAEADQFKAFRALGLEIFNGTVIDPNRTDDFAMLLHGTGRDELQRQLNNSQGRDESILRLASSSTSGYRPLTPYGYDILQENVEEGQVCILVFGGRFFTLVRHSRQLYVLVTDTALKGDDRIVWQRLDQVYGNEVFLDANFHEVTATAEIDDFTVDLDWDDENNKYSNESLQGYRVLGYNPDFESHEFARRMEQKQRAALEGGASPAGDVETNAGADANVESDREMAIRLQREEQMQSMQEMTAAAPLQATDLQAALRASMSESGVRGGLSGQGSSARAAAQSGPTRRWNLDLAVGLAVRNKYYMERFMRSDIETDWEVWQRGVIAIQSCEDRGKDLFYPQHLPYGLDEPVSDACEKIMRREEKVIPDEMRKTAETIAIEELLMRPEEHTCLVNLLEGNGFVKGTSGDGRAAGAAKTTGAISQASVTAADADADTISLYEEGISAALVRPQARNGSTIAAIKRNMKEGFLNGATWDKSAFQKALKSLREDRKIEKITARSGETLYKLTQEGYQYYHYDDEDSDDDDDIPDLIEATVSPEEKAATVLQASWRGLNARQDFKTRRPLMLSSSTTVQASWRGYTVRRDIKYNAAAKAIQVPSRGFLERKHYVRKKAAATRLAAVSRGLLARRYFLRILSTIRINAVVRGFLARKRYGDAIEAGFGEWKRVKEQWTPVRCCVTKARASDSGLFSWRNLKKTTFDISQAEDYDEDKETTSRIDAACDRLASDNENDDGNAEESTEDVSDDDKVAAPAKIAMLPSTSQECEKLPLGAYDNIMLTRSVLKWFDRQDPIYQGFFLRRMRQFATGEYERSQKLRKNLTGCKHIIYEAYLEQKVAQRILFTECRTKDENDGKTTTSILVWYVAKHDYVPRLMKQIDEAEARMNRQFTASASHLFDEEEGGAMILENDTILLDPMANVPLKIHQLPSTDLDKLKMEKWKPPFRLTTDEKKIVQTPGTVLVLGRSGTGKVSKKGDSSRRSLWIVVLCFSKIEAVFV